MPEGGLHSTGSAPEVVCLYAFHWLDRFDAFSQILIIFLHDGRVEEEAGDRSFLSHLEEFTGIPPAGIAGSPQLAESYAETHSSLEITLVFETM